MARFEIWLLVTLSVATADLSFYTPQLTNSPLIGKVTTTTVALDMPQCIFDNNIDHFVWLIVANSTVQLSNADLESSAPYSSFAAKGYYRTLRSPGNNFPCPNPTQYIRVGDENVCSAPDNCNKPLTSPGPYRMKFVVLNSTNNLVDQTGWSAPITLRTGKSATAIDTWPGGRSGGMIVITSILSVLLAVFLACLIGAFIVGSKNLLQAKKVVKKENTVLHEIDMKDYKTHHAQSNVSEESKPSE